MIDAISITLLIQRVGTALHAPHHVINDYYKE